MVKENTAFADKAKSSRTAGLNVIKEAPTKSCLGIQPKKIQLIMSDGVKFPSSIRSICATEKSIVEHCSKLV